MLSEVLPLVHHVLVMSVNPGFGGQKFQPASLARIAHLRRLRSENSVSTIASKSTAALLTIRSPPSSKQERDMLVAGSAIFQPGKTEENAREFLRIARQAGKL